MSFDPFGYHPDAPPPTGPVPPPSPAEYGALPDVYRAQTRERVQIPAMFLIAVGVLNLLVGLYGLFGTLRVALLSADRLYAETLEQVEKAGEVFPGMRQPLVESLERSTPEQLKLQSLLQTGASTAVWLLSAVLVTFGGVRMLTLRSFGLCVLASITAATPCISPCGCCCMGEVVGLWSLLVLLSPEVRMSFQ